MLKVDEKLCIGCGICENKCPIKPTAAILTTAVVPQKEALEVSSMENPGPQSIGKQEVPEQK